jgi:hypothetical protein
MILVVLDLNLGLYGYLGTLSRRLNLASVYLPRDLSSFYFCVLVMEVTHLLGGFDVPEAVSSTNRNPPMPRGVCH